MYRRSIGPEDLPDSRHQIRRGSEGCDDRRAPTNRPCPQNGPRPRPAGRLGARRGALARRSPSRSCPSPPGARAQSEPIPTRPQRCQAFLSGLIRAMSLTLWTENIRLCVTQRRVARCHATHRKENSQFESSRLGASASIPPEFAADFTLEIRRF
jgi:hypothetical protein